MNEKLRLRYTNYSIVFQEVPDEITLAINISGCPYKCRDCHSKYLWEYTGNYIRNDIESILKMYEGLITCVCFMGGDQNIDELNSLLKIIKQKRIKTCVYSGCDNINKFDLTLLDYLKIGRFDIDLGGLDSTTTNQHFYKIKKGIPEDITNIFTKQKQI